MTGYEDDEDESAKKRREIMARRPSYRKILNDLSSADSPGLNDKDDDCIDGGQLQDNDMNAGTISMVTQAYQAPSGILKGKIALS